MLKIKMNGQAQVIGNGIVRDWGKDESGIEYAVDFKVLDNFDVNTESDLSSACDWNSPVGIWNIQEQEEVEMKTVELGY